MLLGGCSVGAGCFWAGCGIHHAYTFTGQKKTGIRKPLSFFVGSRFLSTIIVPVSCARIVYVNLRKHELYLFVHSCTHNTICF